jgi:sugar lactone lactonase YvrE
MTICHPSIRHPFDRPGNASRLPIVLALILLATSALAQSVTFSADLTPPSASTSGPQVTTGATFTAINLGSVVVCPLATPIPSCTETETLAYAIHSAVTLGPTKVVTEGVPNLDFRLTSTTCSGPQQPGATCLVTFTFNPLAPGLRRGAVQLTDTSSIPIATTLLYGAGYAPETAFTPAAETNITTGVNQPSGVAVNAQGDVFYTDSVAGTLLKVPYNARLSQIVLDAGFINPSGVALDGAGNIYVADTGHNIVLKVPPTGGPGVPLGQSLSSPTGVAVDALGNVYISNPPINYVVVLPMSGATEHTVGGSFLNPTGLALDPSGDLFVADTGNGRIVKIPPGAQQITVGPTFQAPLSVAADAAGNLFVGDTNSDGIIELPADNSLPFTLGNGFIRPIGLALGADGNLYIADKSRAEVVLLDRSGPPNLTFATTPVNSVSSDSPQWVTAENIGTAPLFLQPTPTTMDPDFVLVHGPTALPYCLFDLTVAPGSGCTLPFSFQPKSIGIFTSAYVLATNNLNTNTNQSIGLSGTSTGITPQIQLHLPPSASYGSTFTASASSPSPAAITYAHLTGPATVSPTGVITVTGVGLVTLSASQAASGIYLAATANGSFQAVPAGTTITFTAVPVKSGFGTAALITVTVHSDTTGYPSGTVNIFDGTTLLARPALSSGVATFTTPQLFPGPHTFAVSYGGDVNFNESVASDQTLTIPSSTVKLEVLSTHLRYPEPAVLRVHIMKSEKQEPHGEIILLDSSANGSQHVASVRLRAGQDGTSEPILLSLKRGTHTLTALYRGDPKYQPGISNALTITVK